LVIGNDKKGALEVYNLDGSRQQRITTSTRYWANVDLRQGVNVAGRDHDVVAVLNGGLRLYTVDPGSRELTSITDGDGVVPIGWADGLCMYDSVTSGKVSVFAVTETGRVRQYVLTDADQDGLLLANLVREFQVVAGTPPPEAAEGCVADDDNGALYISEEEVGLWRYGAEPGDGAARTPVDTVQPGGNLAADVEGLTIVDRGQGAGYLVASAQNVAAGSQNYYAVYDRRTNVYLESVRIVAGTTADGCQRTDGIAAHAGYLGPAFPQGLFVCQDDDNTAPGNAGNQNFKFTPLEHVVDLGTETPPPDPDPGDVMTFAGAASANGNKMRHSVVIPSTTQAGDVLTLHFVGNRSDVAVTGPDGWTARQSVVGNGILGRLWTRTATSSDAGSSVAVGLSGYTKGDLSVAAYRGTGADPVQATAGSLETVDTAAHTTPSATATETGGQLVSYWADKSATTTDFDLPSGQIRRTGSTGSGSGYISAVLSDSGPVAAGSQGGVTAVASSASHRAVMFTVLLRPAG
jgi:3-phytase